MELPAKIDLKGVIEELQLAFVLRGDRPFVRVGPPQLGALLGFSTDGDRIAAGFIWPKTIPASLHPQVRQLVRQLNPAMPVGRWRLNATAGLLAYVHTTSLPRAADARARFAKSFILGLARLMCRCGPILEAVLQQQAPLTQELIQKGLGQLQPLSESLPEHQRVTPKQWARVLRSLELSPGRASKA